MDTRHLILIIIILLGFTSQVFTKRIYVQPATGTSHAERQRVSEAISNIGTIIHDIPELNGASYEVPDNMDITVLQTDPRFSFVEEVPMGHGLIVPNDYDYMDQWALTSLEMDKVWDIVLWNRTLEKNISLAICDSGFTFNHPDLDATRVIWQYDYVNNDTDATDDNDHGSHVAGIAAATTDNTIGMAGIAYGVNLMIGKVLDSKGLGHYDAFMQCVIDATNNGANIINLSLGGYVYYAPFEDAINYAVEHGVFVVAAAGNTGADGNAPLYPGAFANSFTVANIQQDDTRHPTSTTNGFVDMAAPGTFIEGTLPTGSYALLTGTSQAAPIVASVAALMMAIKPDITVQELTELFAGTATDLGEPGFDVEYGFGKINPLAAATTLMSRMNSSPTISANTEYKLFVNQPFSLDVSCSSATDTCVGLNASNVPSFMTTSQPSPTQITLSATPTSTDIGDDVLTFMAADSLAVSTELKVTFTVSNSYLSPTAKSPTTPDGSTTSSSNQVTIGMIAISFCIASIML